MIVELLTIAALGFIAYRLVGGARVAASRGGRAMRSEIVRGIRWHHVWPVPLVLAAVGAAMYLLLQVPGLDWGWWSALGGDGNPVFGSTSSTAGTVLEWALPLAFMALLTPALPLFAHAEERVFRAGAEEWSWPRRLAKQVQFGLVHALIGVPIGVALALTVGGLYFLAVYLRCARRTGSRRAATVESARAHTAYNAYVVALVVTAVIADAIR